MDSDRLMPYEKEKLYQMMKGDFGSEAELQDSLRLLTELLSEHYGKQVIVLIAIVRQHIPDFLICESEILCKVGIGNRPDFKIV